MTYNYTPPQLFLLQTYNIIKRNKYTHIHTYIHMRKVHVNMSLDPNLVDDFEKAVGKRNMSSKVGEMIEAYLKNSEGLSPIPIVSSPPRLDLNFEGTKNMSLDIFMDYRDLRDKITKIDDINKLNKIIKNGEIMVTVGKTKKLRVQSATKTKIQI